MQERWHLAGFEGQHGQAKAARMAALPENELLVRAGGAVRNIELVALVNSQSPVVRDIVLGHHDQHWSRQPYQSGRLNGQFLAALDLLAAVLREMWVFDEKPTAGRILQPEIGGSHDSPLVMPGQASFSGLINGVQAGLFVVSTGQPQNHYISYQ